MLRCNNLLENPSFELNLTGWESNNVFILGHAQSSEPFEGTSNARMDSGVAILSQDVLLEGTCASPLLVSFQIYSGTGAVGDLIIEVLWLNSMGSIIATGLRTLIPSERTSNSKNRLTFVEITDLPPDNAVMARLQFTRGSLPINLDNILDIDQIILTPISSINLVTNSGFELGKQFWTGTNANESFTSNYEGTGNILLNAINGTLVQNIPINSFARGSSFLLSFAVFSTNANSTLKVEVTWLDKNGNPISTGLDLSINSQAIVLAHNYVTYVDVTTPVPKNANTAQIKFTATGISGNFNIDKVIFSKVTSTNLLVNPSFENSNSPSPWIASGGTTVEQYQDPDSYEGARLVNLPEIAGYIYQDVSIIPERCYLFSFGYRTFGANSAGNLLVQVKWLDRTGREIGLGLSIIIGSGTAIDVLKWLTYLGITEPAPENAAMARVQFSKSFSDQDNATIEIDKVVLASLV
ncbi:hypothetical protein JOC70_001435 [Clostridium pascui]|uniref:hypothetical protein n=1 Tax=Clostridium pascui TaxID=46609 RepID=UPI00195B9869|nr:hypothetical protein [Clostridium pascui]MBM7869965.1 hypothetical protein [Clostridium pascui]